MISRIWRNAAAISGIAGLGLAAASASELTGKGLIDVPPSVLVIGAGVLTGLWALMSAENRRLPFWLTLAAGTGLILASMDFWERAEGALLDRLTRKEILALAGYILVITSRFAARPVYLNTRRYLAAGALLTAVSAAALSALIPADIEEADLSYREGREALVALLHPDAGDYVEDIDGLVDDLLEDETLKPEDREAEIRALNERIRIMEAELALFQEAREQNATQAAEIEKLRRDVDAALKRAAEAESRPDGRGGVVVTLDGEEVRRVKGFGAAVRPDAPIVRDFAVALASSAPGSYYRGDGDRFAVGSDGMKQIIAIHGFISDEWKYVNDPASIGADFYSPAHRTVAAGLAGDCDDFAVLVSSAIEAVGGKTRIMGGSCAEGHHAWPEVYIGKGAAFNEAMKVVHRAYPGRTISYMTDSSGGHWLCLDWQLGIYSCGGSSRVLYQRIGGTS